jgi:hypothetical protein
LALLNNHSISFHISVYIYIWYCWFYSRPEYVWNNCKNEYFSHTCTCVRHIRWKIHASHVTQRSLSFLCIWPGVCETCFYKSISFIELYFQIRIKFLLFIIYIIMIRHVCLNRSCVVVLHHELREFLQGSNQYLESQ